MSDESVVPSIDDANRELLLLEVQMGPAQRRAAYLQGVIAARQAIEAEAKPKRTRSS